jgi:pimeloyl-ACP methyl ester carboxylesterase
MLTSTQTHPFPANQLAFQPYIVKTTLAGSQREDHRVAAEIGSLLVPEKRRNPKSRIIELALVRLRSTAQVPGPPIVLLAGGPGMSGIDLVKKEELFPWITQLREVGDVIALDQRGTGLSVPRLDCLERWDVPLDQPGNRMALLQRCQEKAHKSATFWQSQGVDLSGYTTQENADDIDALRQALGVEHINLCGGSYGSHLALATLRRHSSHIARAIVAMVEGPDDTLKFPGTIQKHLERLDQFVKADANLSGAIPDLLGLMRNVLDRLEREPVTVQVQERPTGAPVAVCLGKFDLQLVTAIRLGSLEFLRQLPARYFAMAHGDFSWLARVVLEFRRGWLGNAMTYLMDCASGCSGPRLVQIQREASQTILGDLINFPFPDICGAWGNPDLGPNFRSPIKSEVPVFFLSGTLDARTPISNAEEVARGFPTSHHLIVEGAAHSFVECLGVPTIRERLITFLMGGVVTPSAAQIPFQFAPLNEGGLDSL